MNIRRFLSAAIVLVAVVSCGRSAQTRVVVTGVAEGTPVSVVCSEADIDTVYFAEENGLEFLLPKDPLSFTVVQTSTASVPVLSDGNTVSVNIEEGKAETESKSSLQSRFNALMDQLLGYNEEVNAKYLEVHDNCSLSQEEQKRVFDSWYDTKSVAMVEELNAVLRRNRNNIVGVYTFFQVMSLVQDDTEAVLKSYEMLGPDAKAYEYVADIKQSLDAAGQTGVDAMFNDFTVRCVEDGEVVFKSLSDYVGKGKYVLVDFWASWCGPCKEEIPYIAYVYNKYAGEDFDVLSVAVWDEPDLTIEAAQANGICWNQIVTVAEDSRIPADAYGIQGIPQLILFGPDGHIVARDIRGEGIAEAVSRFVSEK